MKRLLSFLLIIMLIISVLPLGAFTFTVSAEDTTHTDGYYTYTVSDGEATITDCNTSISGDIVIPDTLGGYTVASIGYRAFESCTSLTSITIPDSVTSIGDWVFYNCTSLADVWYIGSETDKQNITFGLYNTYLTSTTWHYNTCNPGKHTYTTKCDTTCENCEWVRELYKHGDGEINNRDLALLMQYINGWNVNDEIDVSVIDVNADEKINNKDYALLMRYINGWPVELK